MKMKHIAAAMGFIFLLTMGVGAVRAGDVTQSGPTMAVSPSVAPLDRKTNIVIMGSGFPQGQEIFILTEDSLGLLTGLDIVAVPNERGCFAEVWALDQYAARKIITAGVHSIMAAEKDYKVLASAPLALVDMTKDPGKWPEWAKAAGIKPAKKK